jgi:hypothetical protein
LQRRDGPNFDISQLGAAIKDSIWQTKGLSKTSSNKLKKNIKTEVKWEKKQFDICPQCGHHVEGEISKSSLRRVRGWYRLIWNGQLVLWQEQFLVIVRSV